MPILIHSPYWYTQLLILRIMHFVPLLRIRPNPDEMDHITRPGFDRTQIGETIFRDDPDHEAQVDIPLGHMADGENGVGPN
jgi:hypothetical protein